VNDGEREMIDDLFGKLARAERDGGPREAGAEALIRQRVASQPAAPYYMAQVILVQEQALAAAQLRIDELERRAAQPAAGGFLAGLFGGGQQQRPRSAPQPGWGQGNPGGQGYGRQGYGGQGFGGQGFGGQGAPRGGGFMAGAMQTAMGVAGGLVVGNLLMDAFSPDIGQMATDVTQGATDAASGLAADAGFDMGDEIL